VLSNRLELRTYDELVDAIRDASLSASILRREERPWRLAYHLTGSALVQSGVDGAPNVSEIHVAPGRTGLLLVGPGSPPKFVDGREIGAGSLCLLQPGSLVEVSSPAATSWLSVTADPEPVEREAALLAGEPLGSAPAPTVSFSSAPADVATLRTLLLEVTGAFDSAPRGLHPEAAANVERALLRSLARFSLDSAPRMERRRTLRVDRSSAFRSIFEFLRTLSKEPVYLEDLCRATGLPERTLRLLFLEQFGESPVRVLRAHRLCLVYAALQAPGAGLKQIRRVAESRGFWHMGQFSADYRELFGERPTDTVRRARVFGPRGRTTRKPADMPARRPMAWAL
jgi:AraC family ethanolamine operon transcriptional activator